MATVPHMQTIPLPVSIQKDVPQAIESEWRLAYWLNWGGDRSEEALEAIHAAGLTPDEIVERDLPVYYARVLELDAAGLSIEEATFTRGVMDVAQRDPLDSVLNTLRGMSPSVLSADPKKLVEDIRKASALRDAQRRTHHLNVLVRRPDADLDTVIAAIRGAADEIQARASVTWDRAIEQATPVWATRVTNAHDLMRKDLPDVRWLVPDIIAEGLTLLVGKPKKGKSALALQLALALASGGRTLGNTIDVEQCGVLYLALEDNERRMQKRIRRMQQADEAPAALHIAYEWRRADEEGLDDLEAFLNATPDVRVVILDTYAKMRPARAHGANLYDDDYAALDRFHQLCQRHPGLAMVILHHARKAGSEDALDEVSGSLAINGVADNILVMRRQGDTAELHRSGRDYEDDTALGLRGDAKTLIWTLEGTADDLRRSAERKAIIELLRAHGSLTPSEIARELDKNPSTVKGLLRKMLGEPHPPITSENGRYRLSDALLKSDTEGDSSSDVDLVPVAHDEQPETMCESISPVIDLDTLRSEILAAAETRGWPSCQLNSATRVSAGEKAWRLFTAASTQTDIESGLSALHDIRRQLCMADVASMTT